jgi:hypothetical protein
MKILGISGHKGAGKTTVAEFLNDHMVSVGLPSDSSGFSHDIKTHFLAIFGLDYTVAELDDQDVKSEVVKGKTIRQLLQEFGVAMRVIYDDIWVDLFEDGLHQAFPNQRIFVPDVRFPNEVKAIHDLDGHVIRLTRTPYPEDKHESETALDEMALQHEGAFVHGPETKGCVDIRAYVCRRKDTGFDAIIDNANMSIEATNKAVLELVQERGWV